jgi:hypothetical protein
MAGVFRRQMPAMSMKIIPAYLLHGVTAVLALFLLFKALGS